MQAKRPTGAKGHAARRPMGAPAYYALLAAACLAGLALVAAPVVLAGHGFVWLPDALAQQVSSMAYEGEMLRCAFASLAAGQGFDLAGFVFGTGYGDSMRASVTIGDPLKWLTVLVPPEGTEYLYYVIIYVRTYLAAVAFSLYSFQVGRGKGPAFAGSLVYAFCGFALFWAVLRHPSFLNALIMLPLVMLGAEKVFRGQSPLPFVFSVALALYLSTYFAYMTCIALLAYCLVRFLVFERGRGVHGFAVLVGKFIGLGLVGVALGGVAVSPEVVSLLSMNRVSKSGGVHVAALHSVSYYGSLVGRMAGTVVSQSTAKFVGWPAIAAAVALLVCGRRFPRRERAAWLAGLGIVAVVALVPRLGSVMNGFNYVTDRWMFLMAFVAANVVALAVPVLSRLDGRDWRRLGALLGALALLAVVPAPFDDVVTALPVASIVLLAATCGVAWAARRRRWPVRRVSAALACVVLASSATTALFLTSPQVGKGYADEFLPRIGTAWSYFSDASPYAAVDELPESERAAYRYSMRSNFGLEYQNNALPRDRMGLESFHSHYIQGIENFRNELGFPDNFYRSYFYGSDGRLAMDALSAARYFVAAEGTDWLVPDSYEPTGLSRNGYALYRTDLALPLAFSYDRALPRSAYEPLGMAAKQGALLQGCVLEDGDVPPGALVVPGAADWTVAPHAEVLTEGDVQLGDGTATVGKAGATLRFEFASVPDSETYLVIDNLRLDDASLRVSATESLTTFKLKVRSENGERNYLPRTPLAAQTYSGKTSWVSNMGYAADGLGWVEVTFGTPGTYLFDSLHVECQPLQPVREALRGLQAGALADVHTTGRSVSGTAQVGEGVSFALFTIGYSRGWSASVDGNPAQLLKADTGFMAVVLDGAELGVGEHRVELSYKSPGIELGIGMTAAGLAACAAIVIARRRGRKARGTARPA